MIDPTAKELLAVNTGGARGGEYLESIGKFDLSQLNEAEWQIFCGCIVGGFVESLQHQEAATVQLPA